MSLMPWRIEWFAGSICEVTVNGETYKGSAWKCEAVLLYRYSDYGAHWVKNRCSLRIWASVGLPASAAACTCTLRLDNGDIFDSIASVEAAEAGGCIRLSAANPAAGPIALWVQSQPDELA